MSVKGCLAPRGVSSPCCPRKEEKKKKGHIDLNGCIAPEGHNKLERVDAGGAGARADRLLGTSSWMQPFETFDEAVWLAVQTPHDANGKLL